MADYPHRHNLPINDELHPRIYKAMLALTLWLVLSIWFLFDRGAYVGLILAMITVFFVIFAGIPAALWLTWRRNAERDEQRDPQTYREWSSHRFATWTGRISGTEAATQILLPLAAVSIGMTIFGIIFSLAVPQLGY